MFDTQSLLQIEDDTTHRLDETPQPADVLCHGAAPWDEGLGRAQQLLPRLSSHRRVFFVEPAQPGDDVRLTLRAADGGVMVATPHLPVLAAAPLATALVRKMIDHLVATQDLADHVAWYESAHALPATAHLDARLVVYDAPADARPDRAGTDADLFGRADLVLAPCQSAYEAWCLRHPNVFCVASGIDVATFARARSPLPPPADEAHIPRPRIGFAGVIDDRIDLALIAGLAAARPHVQIVLAGPVVKIDPASLPRAANIHYLGAKPLEELPAHLAGWAAALLPYHRDERTRFFPPTRAAEYLAAGRPVIATSLRDVVHPFGKAGLVQIADDVGALASAVDAALVADLRTLRTRADRLLATLTWDATVQRVAALVDEAAEPGLSVPTPRPRTAVV